MMFSAFFGLNRMRCYKVIFIGICCIVGIAICSTSSGDTNNINVRGKQAIPNISKDKATIGEKDKDGQKMLKSLANGRGKVLKKKEGKEDEGNQLMQIPLCNMMKGQQQRKTLLASDEFNSTEEMDNGETSLPVNKPFDSSGMGSTDYVLVATMDGKISLLDQDGIKQWTVPTGQIFSSSISSFQIGENGKWIDLIPSLTGGLYKFDGETLDPLPMNAETLLRRSFRLSNDLVMSGGKEIKTYGIDLESGNVRYVCGMDGCSTPEAEIERLNTQEKPATLVVQKQIQTVRAIDSLSGTEKWNFSVGTHELGVAGVNEGCYEGEVKDDGKVSEFLKVVVSEGLVMRADKRTRTVWQHKFPSSISQAWLYRNGRLIAIDPIKRSPLEKHSPALYVGMHENQFYVQESQQTAEKLQNYYELAHKNRRLISRNKYPAISWNTNAADKQRNKMALLPENKEPPVQSNGQIQKYGSKAVMLNFQPFYVYERDANVDLDDMNGEDETSDDFIIPEVDSESGGIFAPLMSLLTPLLFMWKDVVGISLLTAVVINILVFKLVARLMADRDIKFRHFMQRFWYNPSTSSEEAISTENPEEKALVPFVGTALSSVVEVPCDPMPDLRIRTVSTCSSDSVGAEENVSFCSQYLSEFEPIQCLGRGGFGVVFEAKKKIDDRHYAVKRITLPNRDKARTRVMREVKTLAQLDHTNIVRYFNAWIENPPVGWLEANDPLWETSALKSASQTFGTFTEGYSSISEITSGKPDHSKILIPPTLEDEGDDSFIVFSAHSGNDEGECEDESLQNGIKCNVDTRSGSSIVKLKGYDDCSESNASSKGFFTRPTSLTISKNLTSDYANQLELEPPKDPRIGVLYLYIQQELCQKKTLQDWLRVEKNRNLNQVVNIFHQIVEAVEYVHSKKLIHRDLKPSNIFLSDSHPHSSMKIKIGDFGLVTAALPDIEANYNNPMPSPGESVGTNLRSSTNLTGLVGTYLYASPEQFLRKPYDFKVDIFSLGLIFSELIIPFSTDMERYNVLSQIRQRDFPADFKEKYPTLFPIIFDMVSRNPRYRPDASTVLSRLSSANVQSSQPDEWASNGDGDKRTPRSFSTPSSIEMDGTNSCQQKSMTQKTRSCGPIMKSKSFAAPTA